MQAADEKWFGRLLGVRDMRCSRRQRMGHIVTLQALVGLIGGINLTSMSVEALLAALFCGAVPGTAGAAVPGCWRVAPGIC